MLWLHGKGHALLCHAPGALARRGTAGSALTLTASFQPECAPPMSVVLSDVTVTDTGNNVAAKFGTL